jgi:2,3-dihydroxybenzoate decarboxylase
MHHYDAWADRRVDKSRQPPGTPLELVRRNIRITTAGAFSGEPLRCTLDALGEDNVTYSVDYPFESMTEAAE